MYYKPIIRGEIEIHLGKGETRKEVLVAIAQASFELVPTERLVSKIISPYFKSGDSLIEDEAKVYMSRPNTLGYQVLCLPIVRGRECTTFVEWLADYLVLNAWMYESRRGQLPEVMLERAKQILAERRIGKEKPPTTTEIIGTR